MLNFEELGGGGGGVEDLIDPQKIFFTLNRDERFKFLSSGQAEVVSKWFEQRTRKDNTIKMNTGSGKMLVGLLILKSSLNEGIGPAAYIAPDNYLVKQVASEAEALGIKVTEDADDPEFRKSRAILIANIDKLINGQSVFGVGKIKIELGAVIIDDAHACLESVSNQFTIELPRSHPSHEKLLSLFEDDLKAASKFGWVEIQAEDPHGLMQVPFWAWQKKHEQVLQILHKERLTDELKWNWPLLKQVIEHCRCAFSGSRLEIRPRCLPIAQIPSFDSAKRKIYMTATLADDGVLVTDLNANPKDVMTPIRPTGIGEIGDRMIVAPQQINPDISEDEIKKLAVEISKQHNVVVIVPSKLRAIYWKDVANQTLDKTNIVAGVAKLRAGHIGLTVLINRYDGVDLPGNACRLLVLDGLPEVAGLLAQVDASALADTNQQLMRQIQRIEQGMGRGVRSGEDRCAVLLLGSRLTERVSNPAAQLMFTPATRAQLAMGAQVTLQLKDKPISELRPILDLCMDRDNTVNGMKWWQAGRNRLSNTPQGIESYIDPWISPSRNAFNLAVTGQHNLAAEEIQTAIRAQEPGAIRGYLKQQLAELVNFSSAPEAQTILLAGWKENPRILAPMQGITYQKVQTPRVEQAQASEQFIRQRYLDTNQFIIGINALISDLVWDPARTDQFESAMEELGRVLGFNSQRPEKLYKDGGPDNLWAVGGLSYFVIECKSGVESSDKLVSKGYCNQLLGSVQWFKGHYSTECHATPILVHPSKKFGHEASPSEDMRVIDVFCMKNLKSAVVDFAKSVSKKGGFGSISDFSIQLDHFKLTHADFVNYYTDAPK